MQRSIWLAAALVLLLASGCSPADNAGDPSTGAIPAGEVAEAEVAPEGDSEDGGQPITSGTGDDAAREAVVGDSEGEDGAAETAADDAEPEETDAAAEPPPLGELRATDPGTVALGSGKPQLVEFFAFW